MRIVLHLMESGNWRVELPNKMYSDCSTDDLQKTIERSVIGYAGYLINLAGGPRHDRD